MNRMVLLAWCLLLSSCALPANIQPILALSASSSVAWNERVQVETNAKVKELKLNGVVSNFVQTGKVLSFDLPSAPPLNTLPGNSNAYSDRGGVVAEIISKQGVQLKSYEPFGAVVPGQINVLVNHKGGKNPCQWFLGLWESNFNVVNEIATATWCFSTLDIGNRGTDQALTQVQDILTTQQERVGKHGYTVDKNILYSFDGGLNSFDPTCDQLLILDAIGKQYDQRTATNIIADVFADTAHARGITGDDVTVALIGGGVDNSVSVAGSINLIAPALPAVDNFSCDPAVDGTFFEWHDTHVASLIKSIAPDVDMGVFKICGQQGNCPSGLADMALLMLQNNLPGDVIVNMSLGGPLPDNVMHHILEVDLNGPRQLLVIASAGNHAFGPHYPASFSPGSIAPGSLENVISIGAAGLSAGSWEVAPFTTSLNSDAFAPGANLCMNSLSFRCNASDPKGASGTSFAAPITVGVAALYAEALKPENLPKCLLKHLHKQAKVSMVAFDDKAKCF